MNADTKTTVYGGGAGLMTLLTLVDWRKVFQGDPSEAGKIVIGILLALQGYYTNKS